jgi:hypothetical protein
MKRESDKYGKKRRSQPPEAPKAPCGTLSYLAECRGFAQNKISTRGKPQPPGESWKVRRYAVEW